MIEKLLETLFRHKLLILLPPLIIPLIVTPIAVLTAPSYYEAAAGIWVEKPTYLSFRDDSNPYASPAQNQNAALSEMLRLRAFAVDIALRTDLAGLAGTTWGEERAHEIISRSVRSFPNGSHLLLLIARSSTPDLAYQLVTATAEAFKDKAASDRVAQAEVAISFYESRLKTSQEELAKAGETLRRYVASNPRTGVDANPGGAARLGIPATAADPQLGQLMRRVDEEQRDVDSMRASLERARMDISASLEGQELGFQLVDPAQVPEFPITERRRALIFPLAGVVVGVILSSAMLVILFASDRSARTELDLMPLGRVLGTIPQVQMPDSLSSTNPHGTRRAIGFVAGALPAPGGN